MVGKSAWRAGREGEWLQTAAERLQNETGTRGHFCAHGVAIFVTTSMSAMERHSSCAHPAWQNAQVLARMQRVSTKPT